MTLWSPPSRPYGYPSCADPRLTTVLIHELPDGTFQAEGINRLGQVRFLASGKMWAQTKNKAWWAAYRQAKQFRRWPGLEP